MPKPPAGASTPTHWRSRSISATWHATCHRAQHIHLRMPPMNPDKLKEMLTDLRDGRLSVEQSIERLKHLPFEDIGIAMIDHHRNLRQGAAEVIFGEGK